MKRAGTRHGPPPAPADACKALHNAARDGGDRAVPGQLLSVASLTDGEERPDGQSPLGDGGAP